MNDKPVFLTPDGRSKLEQELELLRTVRRTDIAEKIKYAKDFGDISENAEYDAAKNEQGMIEGRILVLENMLRNAVSIIDPHTGKVGLGSVVTVEDELGTDIFTLVGSPEVDVATGHISIESPVGKALIGHKAGDEVNVNSPSGIRVLKIKKIS